MKLLFDEKSERKKSVKCQAPIDGFSLHDDTPQHKVVVTSSIRPITNSIQLLFNTM